MKIKCVCLATPISGKYHARECPRYKAYVYRKQRAAEIQASDEQFHLDTLRAQQTQLARNQSDTVVGQYGKTK